MLSLTYVSSATEMFSATQLTEMLTEWRAKNHELGLTGMLLYSGGNIIQALEGPEEAVDSLFETIRADTRHRGLLILLREPTSERAFPDWSMGFRSFGREEMQSTDGFNPFMEPRSRGTQDVSASSAHQLLELFRSSMR